MNKYRVNVNGEAFEVEIELIDKNAVSSAPAVAPAPAAAPAPAPAPAPAAVEAPAGAEKVVCPMPGTILSVNVANGDSVKKGQVLFILEAMKMENEIMASKDGVISAVSVTKNSTVQSGDVLCVIG